MRAKYIAKTARRRTVRPDGDEYRVMRRWKTDGRSRRRRLRTQVFTVIGAVALGAIAYFMILRA